MFDLGQILDLEDAAFMQVTPRIHYNSDTGEIDMLDFDEEEEDDVDTQYLQDELQLDLSDELQNVLFAQTFNHLNQDPLIKPPKTKKKDSEANVVFRSRRNGCSNLGEFVNILELINVNNKNNNNQPKSSVRPSQTSQLSPKSASSSSSQASSLSLSSSSPTSRESNRCNSIDNQHLKINDTNKNNQNSKQTNNSTNELKVLAPSIQSLSSGEVSSMLTLSNIPCVQNPNESPLRLRSRMGKPPSQVEIQQFTDSPDNFQEDNFVMNIITAESPLVNDYKIKDKEINYDHCLLKKRTSLDDTVNDNINPNNNNNNNDNNNTNSNSSPLPTLTVSSPLLVQKVAMIRKNNSLPLNENFSAEAHSIFKPASTLKGSTLLSSNFNPNLPPVPKQHIPSMTQFPSNSSGQSLSAIGSLKPSRVSQRTASEISKQLMQVFSPQIRELTTTTKQQSINSQSVRILTMMKSLLQNTRASKDNSFSQQQMQQQNNSSTLSQNVMKPNRNKAEDQHFGDRKQQSRAELNNPTSGTFSEKMTHKHHQTPFLDGFDSMKMFMCFFPQSNYDTVLNQIKNKIKMVKLVQNRRNGKRSKKPFVKTPLLKGSVPTTPLIHSIYRKESVYNN